MNVSDYNGKDNQQEFEKPLHHKIFLWYDRWERKDKKIIKRGREVPILYL
jgi:hypothetical protein